MYSDLTYKELFELKVLPKNSTISVTNELVGKVASFLNGYGIPMEFTVIGVDEESNDIYLNWDCYWFSINESTREIKFN